MHCRVNLIELKGIVVAVRVRPFMERESIKGKFVSAIEVNAKVGVVSAYEYFNLGSIEPEDLEDYVNQPSNYNILQFGFDKVFSSNTQQKQIYQEVGEPVVANVLRGFNGSIIAYGQTGTGKTHTMEGFIFGSPHQGSNKSSNFK